MKQKQNSAGKTKRIWTNELFLFFTFVLIAFLTITGGGCRIGPSEARAAVLIDFGADAASNIHGYSDWRTAIVSPNSEYVSSSSAAGVRRAAGTSKLDAYQGVAGATAIPFAEGDLIVVGWVNPAPVQKNLSGLYPIVSFTDDTMPVDSPGEPQWYAMTLSKTIVKAGERFESYYVFNAFEGEGVPLALGDRYMVNVGLRSLDTDIICDKIEFISAAEACPPAPVGLSAVLDGVRPDTSVRLTWTGAAGAYPIREYRIYRDGIWIYTCDKSFFTVPLLRPGTTYCFTVASVDQTGNQSNPGTAAIITTAVFQGRSDMIDPHKDLYYLGAFKRPYVFDANYHRFGGGDGGIAYYPQGDPSDVDGDADFPGSLYSFGHIRHMEIAEISIPAPVKTKDAAALPSATLLNGFHPIRNVNGNYPGSAAPEPPDVAFHKTRNRFYAVFGDNYNLGGSCGFIHKPTHACFTPDFFSVHGLWYVGDNALCDPDYTMYYSYLFEIPSPWADLHVNGNALLAGGSRTKRPGPGLIALKAWSPDGSDPAPDTQLTDLIKLVYYEHQDGRRFEGWIANDKWKSGDWISFGGKAAVVLSGNKALGKYYYGLDDGTPYGSASNMVPKHPRSGGKGGQAYRYESMFIFYDIDALEKVARGEAAPWEPQPYGALTVDPYLLNQNRYTPRTGRTFAEMTFDSERGLIYVNEYHSAVQGDIVHVFRVGGEPPAGQDPPSAPAGARLLGLTD